MVHRTLFYSSLGLGVVTHGILLWLSRGYAHPWLLRGTLIAGVAASVWNHGVTNRWARRIDRFVMCVGCILDAYFVCHLDLRQARWLGSLVLMLSVLAFAWAKRTHTTSPHVVAHALVTTVHALLLLSSPV
jgi:hypothetical protein